MISFLLPPLPALAGIQISSWGMCVPLFVCGCVYVCVYVLRISSCHISESGCFKWAMAMPCKQHSEKGSVFGSWVCTQSLYNGSRCKLPVVPVVHTYFVRGMVFPWDVSSKLMERRTAQVYVRASSSGHGGLGKPSEFCSSLGISFVSKWILFFESAYLFDNSRVFDS